MKNTYPSYAAHGLMFHHFHGRKHPRVQGSLSQEEFEKILAFTGIQRILSPEEWLEKLKKNSLASKDFCITFDDSLRSQFDIALPVLKKYHMRAFWFITSGVFEGHIGKLEVYRIFRCKYFSDIDDFYKLFFQKVPDYNKNAPSPEAIERQRNIYPFYSVNDVIFRHIRDHALTQDGYEEIMDGMIRERALTLTELSQNLWMTNNELEHLAREGHSLGLHSYSHPTTLAEMPLQKQREEYTLNYNHLKRVCGVAPQAMAHPCNSYSKSTLEILKDLGIFCGFRSNMSPAQGASGLNPTSLEIAREDHANILKIIHNATRHET